MELYYAIMNILDYLALHEHIWEQQEIKLYDMCYSLCEMAKMNVKDIADANDCGGCYTFREMVLELRKQFKNGERS